MERCDCWQRANPTLAWPGIQGIVQPEAYDELAGRITTRSWTYRVRLAAGEVDADSTDDPPAGAGIYEAVIDLSAPRPRVAFLRDITLLQTTAMLAVNASLDHVESSRRFAATSAEPSDHDAVDSAAAGADNGPFEDDLAAGDDQLLGDGSTEGPAVHAPADRRAARGGYCCHRYAGGTATGGGPVGSME